MRVAVLLLTTVAAASSSRPVRLTAAEKEARRFLEEFTAVAKPVARVASEAAWRAATDVTP